MRIKHKVRVQIARDSSMKNLLFAPDDTLSEIVIDTYGKCFSGIAFVLKNTTEVLTLGDITAVRGLYLEADQECTVELNNSGQLLQLRKFSTESTAVAKLFIEAAITQLEVNSPVTLDTNIVYCVWGDVV